MKPVVSAFGIPLGISATFWFVVGLIRAVHEWYCRKKKLKRIKNKYSSKDVAIIIPAHNEELIIKDCIQAAKQLVDNHQIHVVSDGSTDNTYMRALRQGCHVVSIIPGAGKAKALVYAIETYKLFKKYKFILILDADTLIDQTFLEKALPMFNDKEMSVVFASARIHWPAHILPRLGDYFIAYRERLNRLLQYFYVYGQTWKYTNVNYVIPGFATMYRSDILKQLEIDTPGLLIEDFNLAFQFHKKKLGKIGYHPTLIGWDQHPDNLRDYWKQVRRWNIGYFQTVRKNGVWPSKFWLALGIFTTEVTLNSFFVLFIPFLILFHVYLPFYGSIIFLDLFFDFYSRFGPFQYMDLFTISLTIFIV